MTDWPGTEVSTAPSKGGAQPVIAVPNYRGAADARDQKRTDMAERKDEREVQDKGFEHTSGLRKEFEDKSSVKAYKIAIPAYTAALSTSATPQGDISLIYSYAKLMDPESVVRESEADMVTNSDTVSGRWYQKLSKEMTGDGTFRPEVRARLRKELQNRIKYWNDAYNTERDSYEALANDYRFDPKLIIGEHFGRRFKDDIDRYWSDQGPKEPEMVGGVAKGTGVTFAGDDGGFDRNRALMAVHGFDSIGEANLVAWLNQNRGKPGITVADLAAAYQRYSDGRAKSVATQADIDQLRAGKNDYTGFDLSAQEQAFNAKVDALAASRQGAEETIGSGVRGFVRGVTVGAGERISAAASTLFDGGTYDENLANERISTAADKQANPVAEGAGQVAGSLVIPFGAGARTPLQLAKVGAGYGAAYEFNQSDGTIPERIMDAGKGAVIGAAGGYGGGKAIEYAAPVVGKVSPFVTRVFGKQADAAETSAERYARGQDFGVDMSIGDAGGLSPKIIERTLDVQPGSGTIMNTARGNTGEQVTAASGRVADTFGPETSFEGIGYASQTGARKWIDKFDTTVGKAYDAIPIKPAIAASLSATRGRLGELTNKFASNPKLAGQLKDHKLAGFMDALSSKTENVATGLLDRSGKPITREVKTSGDLSWQDLKDFRSRIGEEIGQQMFGEKTLKSDLRGLYSALTTDMEATAIAQGPAALAKFRRANDLYKAGQDRIEGALTKLLGNDGKQSHEKAAAVIQRISKSGKGSSDIGMLAEVRKSMPADEWGQVANGMIRHLGNPAGSEGRGFAVDTFARNYKDMSAEAKNILFGKSELRSNLDEFFKLTADLAASNATRNTSNTAMAITGGMGAFAGGLPGLLGQALVSAGTAKVWTNPKFVKWATGYSKMLKAAEKSGKITSQAKQMELLSKIASREPAISADIFNLQDRLAKAFTGTPERLVATEEEKRKSQPPASTTTAGAPQ